MLFSGATLILQQLQTWQKKKKGMKVIAKIWPYPSCDRDRLIFPASFNRSPAVPVNFCLSDPARSTRFILLVFKLLIPSAMLYKITFYFRIPLAENVRQNQQRRNMFNNLQIFVHVATFCSNCYIHEQIL
jgi:hypothetical protein